jgi:hypothetical protein
MARKALFDHEAMAELPGKQNGVISRSQAQDCGLSDQARAVASEIRSALEAGHHRGRLHIRAVAC